MNDLVSVIIPYYKKKIYFKRCIHSILRQTYKKLEVIIIYDDEEQTDLKFINSVIKNQKNIKLIINKKNFGAGKSRNIGIKKSNGKYLAFLDSDDYWKKDKIKTQLLYMKKRNLDFSHTDYIIIDRWKRRLGTMKVKKELNYDQLLKSCDIGLSTVMIKRSILTKNFFTGLKTKEDYCLWLKLAKKKVKITGLNKELTFWQKSKNSLSSSSIQKICDAFRVYFIYQKKNILLSLFYVVRLSSYFLLKKFYQKKNIL